MLAVNPIVIAHRGASAEVPEHTLEAYERAIEQGADYIEPDLVITRDGHLIARHENEISGTTDVAMHPEFADRKKTKTIDGEKITGWFSEDFTLAEIKTLKARERLATIRPESAKLDGKYEVPTFREVLELLKDRNEARKTPVGVYPETKHPSYFRGIELPLEEPMLKDLSAFGYEDGSPCYIQSFEVGNLQALRTQTKLKLIQLVSAAGKPVDSNTSYREMVSPMGLAQIKTYADGIGAEKSLVIPAVNGELGKPTSLVQDAHSLGLLVHIWTLRPENMFLPRSLAGKPEAEHRAYFDAGIDGFFTDSTAVSVKARREWRDSK
jgi:glycerophosphoryl diester phosphodiesterase